jgi:putative transcriptional regulator
MAPTSLTGHLLVAVPELLDPNFNQTVVLIVQHDAQGASGLVLNRASSSSIGDVLDEADLPSADQPVYVGGPVDGPLMAIHGCVSLGERDVLDNLFFSIERDNIVGVVRQTLRPFRLFGGYSGWGPQQLEGELAMGGWLIIPASAELVFAPEESLWRTISDQIGLEIIFSKPIAANIDPTAN